MTSTPVTHDGDLLWTPHPDKVARTNLTAFTAWLARERGLRFADSAGSGPTTPRSAGPDPATPPYYALWRWSVTDLPGFWQAVWDYCGVTSSAPATGVLASRAMPGAQWFPGARLNYAEHVLRNERPGTTALLYCSETMPVTALAWETLAGQVRVLATRLRELGVRPGDRVVACLPNIPHAVVAMLATTSIGAIWASCSPDFGRRGVIDRFAQLTPKVLFCVDGYRYGGTEFDRTAQMRDIADGLTSLEYVVSVGYLHPGAGPLEGGRGLTWDQLLDHPPVPAAGFGFEQVSFDHPLWVLFSSGTTGLPKPIMHGHGGILLEQLKLQTFHMDLRAGDRMFFFTTTGWMMWNFLVSSLLLGVCPVLYDGNPAYPGPDALWKLAADAGVCFFGASPSYVDLMTRAGVVPGETHDLSALQTVILAGSPVSAACGAWFYRNVKRDLWLATGSGGTDVCTGFVGGVPTLPVYAGEIQARHLGVAAHAFNDRGEQVIDEVGELVITEPMPSMPVGFWGDTDGTRYHESYFAEFPGIWRQGDFFRVNARGGCFVLGRSDATLNRHGVRIGTAEIYAALASVEEVQDGIIVNLDLPGGGFFMPLFVTLADGQVLTDAIRNKICDRLREQYTPRHVPDRVIQVADIPATLTGKKMEVPVRKLLLGVPPEKAANVNAMANPGSLDEFVRYAREQRDYRLG
jgi:acetoacetyl-CoA synthetase